jgi:AcrR family transcriptional regulator
MSKSGRSSQAILRHTVDLVSLNGLSGLSIARVARRAGFSKSGLFAHFGSKTALQMATLRAAAERFTASVVRPALEAPVGEARLRALLERWLAWGAGGGGPGGCPFVAAAAELDDLEGPLREFLSSWARDWSYAIANTAEMAVEAGALRVDLDCRQLAFDFQCIYLGYHYARRLLRAPDAESRARAAFERLLAEARPRPQGPGGLSSPASEPTE